MELNEALAKKVLQTVDAGLVHGKGVPIPGKMCVEAAVCYAMGLPHGDNPQCVGKAVRSFKIRLNDSIWSSNEARTKGLRRIAIAQLGSDQIDQQKFVQFIADATIRQIVPIALRAAASVQKSTEHAMALELAALRCEQEGTREAALDARVVARSADADAYAYADAAADAAAADAYAYAYADAYAYAYAADACAAVADAYAYAAAAEKRDEILSKMADIGVDALIKLGSQGCQWLHLAD